MTHDHDIQSEVVDFLSSPASWGGGCQRVERLETHISHVFLCGDLALKMKKAVRLPYLDFSTLDARRRFCQRELDINRRFSPLLYLGISRVTRGGSGELALDGAGEVVEWLVRMRRFSRDDILASIADAGGKLDDELLRELAKVVADSHAAALVNREMGGLASIGQTLEELRESRLSEGGLPARLEEMTGERAGLLEERARAGYVRRCHGDLHLGNIVLVGARPMLFDALEFSERLATVDILHDLAFLLMDLVHRGHRRAANRVLNWWLQFIGEAENFSGLGLTGLFCACRAAIRAMVTLDLAGQKQGRERREKQQAARAFVDTANACAAAVTGHVIAVGGLSGSGKTTLAAALAPYLAPGPGAAHVRSDVERKMMAGVDEFTRLGPEHYTQEASDAVYRRIIDKARRAARSGWPVIVDAVFLKDRERAAIEEAAREAGARFTGLWLEAPAEVLKKRAARRLRDASDATPEVVEMQLAQAPGEAEGWLKVPAAGTAEETKEAAARLMGLELG